MIATLRHCLIIGLILTSVSAAASHNAPEPLSNEPSWLDEFLDKLGADGEFDADKLIDFSFLPGPFYNPEMQLGVGMSAVGLYQVDDNPNTQLSSLVINALASTNGALGVSMNNKTFLNEDQQRFYLTMELFDVPDVYYGVGYDSNHQPNNRVDFDSRSARLNPMWLQRLFQYSFVGIGFDVDYEQGRNVTAINPDIDGSLVTESSTSVGVDLLINYDSRDNVLNPQQGRIAQLELGIYRTALGSDNNFNIIDLQYSRYIGLREQDVLAWQVRGRFSSGDVPWNQLSKLGGGHLLRGYTSGRYRDQQMLLMQAEYRHHLKGRHGMVYWLGGGVLADEVHHLTDSKVLPSVGLGYRFEVKPRVNLRLDLAFGDGDSGFYFNVNEAF
ncbi:BamA/TamA family outer membrane protein [Paraferrimonas haliotis]|uniref:Membrane protein n=1 Tax=Paraferrimonas haliotis TaxID=2013866 RepID=A0AA37TRT9_9GAMM|nr:BamA/TamA family outer membrane protein [Paraferrimonas haliotis]GLS83281.1 membrane protein [Paraferrimonas haliotis]